MVRGEYIKRKKREPKIKSGMPGSGPQMHSEITNEILQNHKKLRFPNSDSETYNKY
jgi:hypothetical protein